MPKRPDSGGSATLILGGANDSEQAELFDGRSAPIYGSLSNTRLEVGRSRLERALLVGGVVELPDSYLEAEQGERAVAHILFDAALGWEGMQAIRERLIALRATSAGVGDALSIAIDARSEWLRELPWELLEALDPDHALAGCRIHRLVPAGDPRPLRRGRLLLDILVWEPRPDEEVGSKLAAELRAMFATLPRLRCTTLPADLGSLPPPPGEGVARVLHVVGHGRDLGESVALQDARGSAPPASIAGALGRILREVDLVVLDVCSAASDRVELLQAPASHIAAMGVPATLGPRLDLAPEAARDFSQGLYRELAQGASLSDAVAEGRRRIRGLRITHPTGRWWNPVLYLSDISASSLPGLLAAPRVLGWPVGSPQSEELLGAAQALARGWGYLGVEHVALGLAASPQLGRTSTAWRLHEGDLKSALQELRPRATSPAESLPTPRLQALGARLQPGFSPADLALELLRSASLRALLGEAQAARLRAFLHLGAETAQPTGGRPGDTDLATAPRFQGAPPTQVEVRSPARPGPPVDLMPTPAELGPGLLLEVVGGPEDGRMLVLPEPDPSGRPAELGRWGEQLVDGLIALYPPPFPDNTRVSRRHIAHRGAGRIEARAGVRVVRADGTTEDLSAPAGCAVQAGDTLFLDVLLAGGGAMLLVREHGAGTPLLPA